MIGLPWKELCAAAPQGFDAPWTDRAEVDAAVGEGASAYGELTSQAATHLLGWLAPTEADVLFDLGSGTGKLLIQAVCTTPVGRAVGVELSAFRHQAAVTLRDALLASSTPEVASLLAPRLELRREDLRVTDLSAATLIYAGSTCYPDPLLQDLARAAGRGAPHLRALASSRPVPDERAARLREVGRFRARMSWSPRERIYVYERAD